MAKLTKKRNGLFLGIFILLSLLLLGAIKTHTSRGGLVNPDAGYEKLYSFDTNISISKNITPEELQVFYDFAIGEYRNANFGISKDLLEAITQKSDDHPMSWYYLAEIYKKVYPYSQSEFKKKTALLNITKSPLSDDLKISAYDDLANLSSGNPDQSIEYGKKAVVIKDNVFSRYILMTAYYNAYKRTGDDKYRSALGKVYDPKTRFLFGDGKFAPWAEEVLANR